MQSASVLALSLMLSVSMGQCARMSEREAPIPTEVASPTMVSQSMSVSLVVRDYSLLPSVSHGILADPTHLPNGTTVDSWILQVQRNGETCMDSVFVWDSMYNPHAR